MMEHIRQHDWYSSKPETHFLNEADIDNCVIERIIRNQFHDPMLESSSDSENETPRQMVDWSKVFVQKDTLDNRRIYVPGTKGRLLFPKLSALTKQQHYAILKILCAENPDVLSLEYIQRPNNNDHRTYEKCKDTYLKEQKEFIEWAKTLWTSKHCLSALRPKPTVEMVYEAEFKMKAAAMGSFPKKYKFAAQIPLDNTNHKCDMILKQDLINVSLLNMPKVKIPELVKRLQILPCPVPEPCEKHPCWFVLPNEKSSSVLPLTEIHRELAQYALNNGVKCIASEGALKCLIETGKYWTLPVTVCQCRTAGGDKENVVVFGSEFSTRKKDAMSRTYSAYRHLLEYTLIPESERARVLKRLNSEDTTVNEIQSPELFKDNMTDDEDQEENNLATDEDIHKKMTTLMDSESEDDLVIDETTFGTAPQSPCSGAMSPRNSLSSPKPIIELPSPRASVRSPITTPQSPRSSAKQTSPNQTSENKKKSDNCSSKDIHKKITALMDSESEDDLMIDETTFETAPQSPCNGAMSPTRSLRSPKPTIELPSPRTIVKSPINTPQSARSSLKSPITTPQSPRSSAKQTSINQTSENKKKSDKYYNCSCKDYPFERPPQRSFKRWQVRNFADSQNVQTIDLIVHCPHKMKGEGGEVIIEPIPEYQIELAGSKQSDQKLRSLALSLHLRKNPTLVNVRVDVGNGDVVTIDKISKDDFNKKHMNIMHSVANVLYESIDQLQGLMPGHYILQHEPRHGTNALLYSTRSMGSDNKFTLDFNIDLTDTDEAKSVKDPPMLTPVLLPINKFHKILPCAFAPYEDLVMKEIKKPEQPKPKPPKALQWPKRKRKKNRKKP